MSPKPELPKAKKEGYYRALGASLSIIAGAFLLLEHIWSWGGADVDDPMGHETYGMILMGIGYLIVARRNGKWLIGK